jgi:hypothetical protein
MIFIAVTIFSQNFSTRLQYPEHKRLGNFKETLKTGGKCILESKTAGRFPPLHNLPQYRPRNHITLN